MHIEVSERPNILGTYRYDVRAVGRSTYGYRRTPTDARHAAREDGDLLYMCGRAEQVDEPEVKLRTDRPVPRRLRTGKNGGLE